MSETISGTLIVTLLRAQNLLNKDNFMQGLSDPYVKLSLIKPSLPDSPQYMTKVIDDNLNPCWNEAFYFVFKEGVEGVSFKCQVYDKDISNDDLLGHVIVEVKPGFQWRTEQSFKLIPPSEKERYAGEIILQVDYLPGQWELGPKSMNLETKKSGKIRADDFSNVIHYKRTVDNVLSNIEEEKMQLLQTVFNLHFNQESPIFKVDKKEKFLGALKYQKASYKVDLTHHNYPKWEKMMEKSDGAFKVNAQQIIESILAFQKTKRERPILAGYLDDPENLFCEELKNWAATILSTLEISKTAENQIIARLSYIDQILLTPNLFDNPTASGELTITDLLVNIRRVLKSYLLPEIEKELSRTDSCRALEELRKHCRMVIYNCYTFLEHVFRSEEEGVVTAADKLLKTLQTDPNLKSILGDTLTETLDKIQDKQVVLEKYSFSLGESGLKPVMDFLDLTQLKDNDPTLSLIFTNTHSGIEDSFQNNSFITYRFLRSHALLIELGKLFIVLEKAIQCAKTGGTLLVYGVSNNHLNMTLDFTKTLITSIREEFTSLSKIAECAFEKVIFKNNILPKNTKNWTKNYHLVFPSIVKINDAIKLVYEDISGIKLCANSISLYEKWQNAEKENEVFLESAKEYSERMERVLGVKVERVEWNEEEAKRRAVDNKDYYMGKMKAVLTKEKSIE